MAEPSAKRVEAFEGFIELVTERGRQHDYLARIRRTFDPFLRCEDSDAEPVDAVLRAHAIIALAAHVRWMRPLLAGPLRGVGREVAGFAEEVSDPECARALVGLAETLAESKVAIRSEPRHIRRTLDAFLAAPDQHARQIDSLVEAHTATWLAGRFPLARPMLPRLVRVKSKPWLASLQEQLIDLKKRDIVASGRLPVRSDLDFGLLRTLELGEGYESWADRYRGVLITARFWVAPEAGFRLRELNLHLGVPESVIVESVGAQLAPDGSDSEVVVTTSREHVSTSGGGRTGKLSLEVTGPLGIGGAVSVESNAATSRSESLKREVRDAIKDGVRLQATAKEHKGTLNVTILEDRVVAPGDGGHELHATVTLNALVPLAAEDLDLTFESDLKAGWYEGVADGTRTLELPPRAVTEQGA